MSREELEEQEVTRRRVARVRPGLRLARLVAPRAGLRNRMPFESVCVINAVLVGEPTFLRRMCGAGAGPVVSGDGSRDRGHGPRDALLLSSYLESWIRERDWLCILGGGHGVPGDRRFPRGSVRGGRQDSLRIDV